MMNSNETMYELYFAQVAGHVIDVREIMHISPIEYDKYDEVFYFYMTQKGVGSCQNVRISNKDRTVVEEAHIKLVAAHAKLWLPYEPMVEEEKENNVVALATTSVPTADNIPTEDDTNA